MSEPDEAMIWARENAAKQCDRDREPRIAAAYRQGQYDDDHLKADAEAYRAGQAASAERIKALKGAIDKLLSACERLDVYEVKSTELWAAYHFALNVYDDFVWSPEENAEAAASAERIKALEEAIREALRQINEYADMPLEEWGETIADNGAVCWMFIRAQLKTVVVGDLTRTLLKEADE